ncbi:MAG: hypothetical protein GY765_05665 [bacterium]|nr:hypothetical protein [bacterium]
MNILIKRFILCFVIFLLFITFFLHGKTDFKQLDQWSHDTQISARVNGSIIDANGNLVVFFRGPGLHYVIDKNTITQFGPFGNAPSDISGAFALFNYADGDIAVLEGWGKTKIFTPKNKTYVWRATKWYKQDYRTHIAKEGIFYKNKLFLAGKGFVRTKEDYVAPKKDINMKHSVFFLRVYDENGKPLKQLLTEEIETLDRFVDMSYYLTSYKDRIYYLREDKLQVKIICPEKLEVVKEISLQAPEFHKKMPADYFAYKKYKGDEYAFKKDLEHWRTSYGRISNALVDGDTLVLQIRTCNEKMKRYALLFYNAETFKLEKTVVTDDYLLAAKNGRYYLYADGNPGRDKNTEKCKINVCSFSK